MIKRRIEDHNYAALGSKCFYARRSLFLRPELTRVSELLQPFMRGHLHSRLLRQSVGRCEESLQHDGMNPKQSFVMCIRTKIHEGRFKLSMNQGTKRADVTYYSSTSGSIKLGRHSAASRGSAQVQDPLNQTSCYATRANGHLSFRLAKCPSSADHRAKEHSIHKGFPRLEISSAANAGIVPKWSWVLAQDSGSLPRAARIHSNEHSATKGLVSEWVVTRSNK